MLDEFDRRLLNLIQTDLPLVERPFAELARRLGSEEAVVLSRLAWLRQNGYIRRIGPFFDSARLGYVSTLVALKVRDNDLPAVAAAVNAISGVTHNYEREGPFNLWFTLLSPSRQHQEKILQRLKALPGVEQMISLPARHKFKVSVEFRL